ncbi:ABC transporter permease [Kitasatospora sp. NPDC005748]|uniref:ABC transporter permease n=1 Tax=Kitasatospora sp. NPDC005748 TaxID=3157063 RepID=UPI00340C277D
MTTSTAAPAAAPAVAPAAVPATASPVRFGDLLASEWIKMRSLRSTPWAIAVTTVFVIGSAVAATMAAHDGAAVPGAPREFLPFNAFPAAGYWTLMLVAATMGAITVVSEYSSGLIRTTTVAVPARGQVVLAKAAVTAALWTAVGAATAVGSFLASQAVRGGGAPATHPGLARALVACTLVAPICALVGLGLGVLIRHTATTVVTGVFTLVLLPPMFSEGTRWSADVNHLMPSTAWRRLVQNWPADPDSLAYTATVPGSWAVYLLWPLVAVVLAVVVVRRRDV